MTVCRHPVGLPDYQLLHPIDQTSEAARCRLDTPDDAVDDPVGSRCDVRYRLARRRGVEKEGLKDGIAVLKVVGDNVDEVRVVHDAFDESTGRRAFGVEMSPLETELKCFVPTNIRCLSWLDIQQLRDWAAHFQAMKLIASTMVGWTISFPGKTPHVTAFGPSEWVLVRRSPWRLTA